MNFKDKLLIQCVACFVIFALVQGSSMIKVESFSKLREEITEQAQTHNSMVDIKNAGSKLVESFMKAPSVLTNAVIAANSGNQFSAPIDEATGEQVQPVYASAGGVVIYAGIDKKLGSCIKIRHQNKISTYGNLHTIVVVPDERITKGQIIGTFDNNCNKEFYYQLADNMI